MRSMGRTQVIFVFFINSGNSIWPSKTSFPRVGNFKISPISSWFKNQKSMSMRISELESEEVDYLRFDRIKIQRKRVPF